MRTTLTLLTTLTLTTPAAAQLAPPPCGPYPILVAPLGAKKYGQRPVEYAFPDPTDARRVLELWHNPETGTYSIISVVLSPTGVKSACMIYAGSVAPQPSRLAL